MIITLGFGGTPSQVLLLGFSAGSIPPSPPGLSTANSRVGHYVLTKGLYKRMRGTYPLWTSRRYVVDSTHTKREP